MAGKTTSFSCFFFFCFLFKFKMFNVPSVAQTCSIVPQQVVHLLVKQHKTDVNIWSHSGLLELLWQILTLLHSERPKLCSVLAFFECSRVKVSFRGKKTTWHMQTDQAQYEHLCCLIWIFLL